MLDAALFDRPVEVRLGVVVALLAWVQQNAVISLWCVWAAATSVLINLYLRSALVHTPTTALVPEARP